MSAYCVKTRPCVMAVGRKNSIKQIADCTHDANHGAQTLRPHHKRHRCDVGTRHLMWGEFAVDRARQGPTTYADGRDCNDQTMNAMLCAGINPTPRTMGAARKIQF